MPELPEVQTVLDTLASRIKDRQIVDIEVIYPPIIEEDVSLFKESLIGQHFRSFRRRGKYLLFEMDDLTLVCHLRMEGKFFLLDESVPIGKHDHVIFLLDDGIGLRYNDVRKFGRMEIIEKKEDYSDFHGLGPEPFDRRFSVSYCRDYLKGRTAPIKQVLLDQSFVAGIGNIYADEILFAIKTDPRKPACELDEEQLKQLIRHTRRILKKAIAAGGTTIRSYTSSLGVTGRFQLKLKVHGMKDCPSCKGKIRKIRVGGRGTYYCERCQRS